MSFAKKWSPALLLLAAMSQGAMADPRLQLSTSGPQTVDDVNDFSITATLKNIGDVPLKLFNEPNGALSKSATKTFKVAKTSDGTPATFAGIAVKYNFDRETSFTNLAVGEVVEVTHGLSNGYQINSPGDYTVTPSTIFYYADADGKPVKIQAELVSSHTAKVTSDANLKSRAIEKRRELYRRSQLIKRDEITATTQHCTSAQSTDITQAMFYASAYAASAEKYLTLHNATSDRYKGWFGDYNEDNHALVLSHFTKISTSDVKKYTYDCTCEGVDNPEATFAYVFPDQFGHVYLCGSFMTANISGTDSKAGTMVHEASHFLANGGTQDLGYGHELAGELAQTNATAACNNADSHEYFAENANPWLA